MNEVLFLLPCMAALTQLVAKSFGFVFGLTTMTLRIARWCFDFLFEKSIVTARSEIVKGSEPSENVLLGKSTLNQIERWWRELRDRFEKYFKEQLMPLLEYLFISWKIWSWQMRITYIWRAIIANGRTIRITNEYRENDFKNRCSDFGEQLEA